MTTVQEANANATKGGRFKFVRVLGQGGFGTVILAKDYGSTGQQVAVKCVKAGSGGGLLSFFLAMFANQKEALKEAREEADLLMKLRHPHIVSFLRAYDYQTGGRSALAIVTEFCEEGDLDRYLQKPGQQPDSSKRPQWFEQLTKGLQYIHDNGIVHRDIKPQNVLITSDMTLKIADVGLAKSLYDVQNHFGGIDTSFQQYMSTLAGTPAYMAPEVWAQHYEQKSDIFSLGLVFVVMAETPSPLMPLARWDGEKSVLGHMYYQNRPTRSIKPSQLLHVSKATPGELKLFDSMLVYDYHERLNARDVLMKVKAMTPQRKPRQPDEDFSFCSCCLCLILPLLLALCAYWYWY